MNGVSVESARMAEQERIDAGKTIDDRRAMGQFATPAALAGEIAEATLPLLGNANGIDLLEPSAGTGAFISAFFSLAGSKVARATAIELDPAFFEAGKRLWSGFPCDYVNADFTQAAPDRAYGLVVANPPYVRHHGIEKETKMRLQSQVRRETGLCISGLAGLYCHFLLLSRKWMAPGGLGVWLVPAEWMSVNYGSAIRTFLSEKVQLLRVHRFAADDVRFSDALVSSCVVWFRNAPPSGEASFTEGPDLLRPARSLRFPPSVLRSSAKWPPRESQPADGTGRPKLRDFFVIRRGIATGDNAFFVLPEATAAEKGIPGRFLKPILPSPRHLKTDWIQADRSGFPSNAERLFLLDCTGRDPDMIPEAVRSYLESGRLTTGAKKLCASRDPWFAQEQRLPAPILCSYMGRGSGGGAPVRFILNESDAIAANSYLMLYPKELLRRHLTVHPDDRAAVWNLLREIPPDEFRRAGRCYGGGLQKMEPRELGDLDCSRLRDWLSSVSGSRFAEEETGQLLFAMEPPAEYDAGKARRRVGSAKKPASASTRRDSCKERKGQS